MFIIKYTSNSKSIYQTIKPRRRSYVKSFSEPNTHQFNRTVSKYSSRKYSSYRHKLTVESLRTLLRTYNVSS